MFIQSIIRKLCKLCLSFNRYKEVSGEATYIGEERATISTSVGPNALLLLLETIAHDCNVTEVEMLLRRVRSVFARLRGRASVYGSRQLLIGEMLQRSKE